MIHHQVRSSLFHSSFFVHSFLLQIFVPTKMCFDVLFIVKNIPNVSHLIAAIIMFLNVLESNFCPKKGEYRFV